ncbi:MAG: hypothetical protein AAF050_14285 [Cyanobacteria bacterium J06649_5]
MSNLVFDATKSGDIDSLWAYSNRSPKDLLLQLGTAEDEATFVARWVDVS